MLDQHVSLWLFIKILKTSPSNSDYFLTKTMWNSKRNSLVMLSYSWGKILGWANCHQSMRLVISERYTNHSIRIIKHKSVISRNSKKLRQMPEDCRISQTKYFIMFFKSFDKGKFIFKFFSSCVANNKLAWVDQNKTILLYHIKKKQKPWYRLKENNNLII